jgi:hypothetical protein
MNRSEFVALARANTDRTSNIRISSNWNSSGVSQVKDGVAKEFGCVIALLQAQIEKGQLCKKDEFLLIYNFQLIQTVEEVDYYSLDMLIKPIHNIEEIEHNGGRSLQLIINGATSEVMNNSKGMVDMDLCSEKELLQNGEDAPTSLGNYNHYSALYNIEYEVTRFENNSGTITQQRLVHELLNMQKTLKEQIFESTLVQEENLSKSMLNSYRPQLTAFAKEDKEPQVRPTASAAVLIASPS